LRRRFGPGWENEREVTGPGDEELFTNDVLEKFAEGLAQGDHFS
jgi:hypothetical protein